MRAFPTWVSVLQFDWSIAATLKIQKLAWKLEKAQAHTMASRRELQRLEDENRTLSQRLSDTEVELSRKADELKTTSVRYVQSLIY